MNIRLKKIGIKKDPIWGTNDFIWGTKEFIPIKNRVVFDFLRHSK